MAITTQDFTTLVRNQVTAIQGAARTLIDLTIGSTLRAVVEGNAGMVLWLQGLILQLLVTTRAATSSEKDLDSWVEDYGFYRLKAATASGLVTFARFTPTQQAVIPIGTTVQTADGTQNFAVTIDTANAAYSAALGGYVLGDDAASISVPVAALAAGAAANASAGQITTLTQAVSGVDTVSNAAAFINGADAEKDPALRVRFVAYIASLSKATKGAISYAIASLKPGTNSTLVENFAYNGTAQPGYFYAVIDDGTGYPSAGFLSSASNAIDAVRAFTSTFGVFAPVVVTANPSVIITTAAGYDHIALVALVGASLTSYINTLALGQSLSYSRLAQIAYDASPGVTNVTGVTLNGGTADLTATAKQVIKAGTVTVA